MEVDVQGAMAIREQVPDALLVFLRAPSREVQRERLAGPGRRRRRAGAAPRWPRPTAEEALADRFDAVVVNDDADAAVAEVAAILAGRRAAGDDGPDHGRRRPDPPISGPPAEVVLRTGSTHHMAERRASLMEPRIESLLDRENSKFTLVTLAATPGPRDQRLLQPARRGPRQDRAAAGDLGVPQAALDRARGDRGRQDRQGRASSRSTEADVDAAGRGPGRRRRLSPMTG